MMAQKPFGLYPQPIYIPCYYPNGLCCVGTHWMKCFKCGVFLHIGTNNHKCFLRYH